MPKVRIALHQRQADFLDSRSIFRGFVGGRGAGKSFVGAYDLIRRTKANRFYAVISPTYKETKRSTLRTFNGIIAQLGLKVKWHLSDLICTMPHGGQIVFQSGDDPESLRGPNLSGIWIDEASLQVEDVYSIAIASLRECGEQGWLSATFTPKGKQHWTFDVFGRHRPNTSIFHAATGDNPFLPVEFEENVRSQYTSHFAEQELGGNFIDPPGQLFQRGWVRLVNDIPHNLTFVRYWDKAGTDGGGAYSCGVLMGKSNDRRYYIVDVVRGQWSAGQRNLVMQEVAQRDRLRGAVKQVVEQEPGSGGKESAEITIRELAGHHVEIDRVTGDKVTRFMPFAAQAEHGNVYVLDAPWVPVWIDELASFPTSKYRDQVDGTSGAFNKLAPMSTDQRIHVPGQSARTMMGGVLDSRW